MIEKSPISPLFPSEGEKAGFKGHISFDKKEISFQKVLTGLIEKVGKLEKNADEAIQKLISGEIGDIHQVMMAAEEANIAFQLMMEIRNKLIEAYKEIMHIQI